MVNKHKMASQIDTIGADDIYIERGWMEHSQV